MKNLILYMLCTVFLYGQTQPLTNLHSVQPGVFILENATVHTEPGETLHPASIIIRDGHIEAVGKNVKAPADATRLDMDGAQIYAGFIDAYVEIKSPQLSQGARSNWSDLVHPEWVAVDNFTPDAKQIKARHKLGFTHMHAVLDSGIFRGQSSLIALDKSATVSLPEVSQVMDFYRRPRGSGGYPEALLGTIAVMRQTLYDADWYHQAKTIYTRHPDKNKAPEEDIALASLAHARTKKTPFLIKTKNETYALRAFDISHEFDLNHWLMGSGYEYRRQAEIAAAKPFIILPLNYPGKPDITDPYRAAQYTTDELKHWDMAPDNALRLTGANVDIAFSTSGLKELKQFRKNLEKSIDRGLSKATALAALTTTPSAYFGLGQNHGKIKAGYLANLVVVDGDYFETENPVKSLWIGGIEHIVDPEPELTLHGKWDFNMETLKGVLAFQGKPDHPRGTLTIDTSKFKLKNLRIDGSLISWSIDLNESPLPKAGVTRFRGSISAQELQGLAVMANGGNHPWTARNHSTVPEDKKQQPAAATLLQPTFPEGAFGFQQLPEQPRTIFINDATLWTSGPQGIMKKADLIIEKGKIKKIGQNLSAPRGSHLIEATGKHVTPGLIDPHSHTAGESINEGSQSVTSEVRIQDVLDPDDINIYRQLAGGLTTIHVLHGSANTIGGQNSVIKLRWGSDAHSLIMEQAPLSLKLALGENVKQSNWGDNNVTRYPQTRMGVEQVLRDAFTRAQDYQIRLDTHAKRIKWRKTHIPPRKDLELEPLVEILKGNCRVHVHSYRQDEILMMLRVAEDFGFTVTNMEHVLEGYKVADEMARHGAGAATFSDWWAYKFEVYDAIPYNAVIMQDAGVLVSFKSDSDELARRMNLEAAKGIKYGGMTEIEAMNTVTINPATQLHIDQWVGSLEVGKDADFVVWSKHPLSTQAVCEQTWIEGRRYFSLEQNTSLLRRDDQIRQKLFQKILKNKDDENDSWEHYKEHSRPNPNRDDLSWERGVK